jgi:hypothetical protein
MMTDLDEVFCAEELRLALSPVSEVALSASAPEVEEAKAALGLETRAEHDGEPACGWCGRSSLPGGLADESLGGPEDHACVDAGDCADARA